MRVFIRPAVTWLRAAVRRTRDGRGQGLAEYGPILALVSVVSGLALAALGLAVSGRLDEVVGAFGWS